MAIGQIQPVTGRKSYLRRSASPEAFGAGVARALTGLGEAAQQHGLQLGNLAEAQANLDKRDREFRTRTALARYKGEQIRNYRTMVENMPLDASGFTNGVEEQLRAQNEAFMADLHADDRRWVTEDLESFNQTVLENAFLTERGSILDRQRTSIDDTLEFGAGEVFNSNSSVDEQLTNLAVQLSLTELSEGEQDTIMQNAARRLLTAEAEMRVMESFAGGQDWLALPSPLRGLMMAILDVESGGKFDVVLGGATFDDFSDHPRTMNSDSKGRRTSAAGGFQFIQDTWDMAARNAGVTDFTPASQLKAALWLAEYDYNRKRGATDKTFEEVVASGTPEDWLKLKDALQTTWEGLDPSVKLISDEEFLAYIAGSKTLDTGFGSESVIDDPRYDMLSLAEKQRILNSAQTAANKQQQAVSLQVAAEREATMTDLMRRIRNGEYTQADVRELQRNGTLQTQAEIDKAWKAHGDWREQERTTEQATGILSGQVTGYLDGTHDEAIGDILGPDAGQKLSDMDQAYVNEVVLPILEKSTFLPSAVGQPLSNMLMHGTADQRTWAAQVFAGINMGNPYVLDGATELSEEARSFIDYMAINDPFGQNPAYSLQEWERLQDPQFASIMQARRDQASTLLSEENAYNATNIGQTVFDTWTNKALPEGSQGVEFQKEFNEHFLKGYEMFSEQAKAEEYAKTQLRRDWNIIDWGSGATLMKHPPERFYGPEGQQVIATQIHSYFAENNVPVDTPFQLVSIPGLTQQQGLRWEQDPVAAGHNAPYQVLVQTEELGWVPLRDADGGMAWTFSGEASSSEEGDSVEQFPPEYMDFQRAETQVINETNALRQLRDQRFNLIGQWRDTPADQRTDELHEELRGQLETLDKRISDREELLVGAKQEVLASHTSWKIVGNLDIENAKVEELRAARDTLSDHLKSMTTFGWLTKGSDPVLQLIEAEIIQRDYDTMYEAIGSAFK